MWLSWDSNLQPLDLQTKMLLTVLWPQVEATLCAMKRHTVMKFISPPVGFEPNIIRPLNHLTHLLLNTTCHVLANSVDPDQLKKLTDLNLHCLSLNM